MINDNTLFIGDSITIMKKNQEIPHESFIILDKNHYSCKQYFMKDFDGMAINFWEMKFTLNLRIDGEADVELVEITPALSITSKRKDNSTISIRLDNLVFSTGDSTFSIYTADRIKEVLKKVNSYLKDKEYEVNAETYDELEDNVNDDETKMDVLTWIISNDIKIKTLIGTLLYEIMNTVVSFIYN